jgi:tetratricopeptide (TPR) repeat protein
MSNYRISGAGDENRTGVPSLGDFRAHLASSTGISALGGYSLGQVLGAQQKTAEAYGACSQPLATDSNYLPAYLCLADLSAHSESWNTVLQLSTRALEIDPTNDAEAYDYNAVANFHLHGLPKAETSTLRAAEIDKSNTDPRVHFLLAQIYEAKGDRQSEAAQLREYLKYASDPNDVAMVKRYSSELEKPTK